MKCGSKDAVKYDGLGWIDDRLKWIDDRLKGELS